MRSSDTALHSAGELKMLRVKPPEPSTMIVLVVVLSFLLGSALVSHRCDLVVRITKFRENAVRMLPCARRRRCDAA